MERLLAYWYGISISKHPHLGINLIEFLAEEDNGPVLSLDKVQALPAKLEDNRPQVKDPLEKINVRTANDPRPLFISVLLPHTMKVELCHLLHEFKDCFAWSYHEMPGLTKPLSSMNYVSNLDASLFDNLLDGSRPKYSLALKMKLFDS
ncbi:hypothetical protein ACFXTH_006881 [Malus domestica]